MARRLGTYRVGFELALADLVQDRLCHERACRIVRAQEQHVESRVHVILFWKVIGKKARKIAAELRPSRAAGLGQDAEQGAQTDKAHGVNDMPPLACRLDELRLLERGEMEGQRRRRLA